jgi:hypothetical protein
MIKEEDCSHISHCSGGGGSEEHCETLVEEFLNPDLKTKYDIPIVEPNSLNSSFSHLEKREKPQDVV